VNCKASVNFPANAYDAVTEQPGKVSDVMQTFKLA